MTEQEIFDAIGAWRQSINDFCRNECASTCCTMDKKLTVSEEAYQSLWRLYEGEEIRTVERENGENRIMSYGVCPHLDLDYSCSIYENRPIECRTHPVLFIPNFLGVGRVLVYDSSCDLFAPGFPKELEKIVENLGLIPMEVNELQG